MDSNNKNTLLLRESLIELNQKCLFVNFNIGITFKLYYLKKNNEIINLQNRRLFCSDLFLHLFNLIIIYYVFHLLDNLQIKITNFV
jgi:hypothetical protein